MDQARNTKKGGGSVQEEKSAPAGQENRTREVAAVSRNRRKGSNRFCQMRRKKEKGEYRKAGPVISSHAQKGNL